MLSDPVADRSISAPFCSQWISLESGFPHPPSNDASPEMAHAGAERGNRNQFAKLRFCPFDPVLRAPLPGIGRGGSHLFIFAGPREAELLHHVQVQSDPQPAYFPEVRFTANSPADSGGVLRVIAFHFRAKMPGFRRVHQNAGPEIHGTQDVKIRRGDHGARARRVTEHDRAAHRQSFKSTSRFRKDEIVEWEKNFRILYRRFAAPLTQHIEGYSDFRADLAHGGKMREACGLIAENCGAFRNSRQRAARAKSFQIDGIEDHVNTPLRNLSDTFQAAAAAAIDTHVSQDPGKIYRLLGESTGGMTDKKGRRIGKRKQCLHDQGMMGAVDYIRVAAPDLPIA